MYSTHKNLDLIQTIKPLVENERILITGASGWLGKNLVELLLDVFENKIPSSVLLITSEEKIIDIYPDRKVLISTWDQSIIEKFRPTIFINLGFLTRDKLLIIPKLEYISQNLKLIENANWVVSLPTVKYILTTSSGVSEPTRNSNNYEDKPYENLKFHEEQTLMKTSQAFGKNLLILRVWTISGKYIKRGDLLVIESIISAMLENKDFEIRSKQEIWRTYINAYEMMGLAILGLISGRVGIINSGGIKVSLSSLAQTAVKVFNSKSKIIYLNSLDVNASYYLSIPPDLNQVASEKNIKLMNISEQLIETAITLSNV